MADEYATEVAARRANGLSGGSIPLERRVRERLRRHRSA
jgi:hypothetical protein